MSPAAENRGPITLGIMLAAVMSALDTTVANVALPHMQGNLSASPEQITWVLTSYMVAAAVTTPVTGWLAARVGLKPMLLVAVAGFSLISVLCGLATSLPEMVVFRALQGMLAAPLLPLGQSVLLNINPPERYGRAMAIFTVAGVVAPAVGPVVGGYLTEDLSWRWCFYINLPAGIASILLLAIFMPKEPRQKRPFDFLGFGSLAIAVAALQLLLDRGPTQDWFSSREIWVEAILTLSAFWIYVTHTVTARHPLFHPALARDRNFVSTTVFGFFLSTLAYASMSLLPLLMQGLLGYPVIWSGLLSMPRGVVMMVMTLLVGRLDTLVDRRLLVACGVTIMTAGFWQMTQFDLGMGGDRIVLATVAQGLGQGMVFVPLTTLAFATMAPELRADASAINNLLRNLGGSVGISLMQALLSVNGQAMHAALAARAIPGDPVLVAGLPAALSPRTTAGALALNDEITRQASMVAFIDDFRLMVLIGVCSLPLILLLRQPRRLGAAPIEAAAEAHAG